MLRCCSECFVDEVIKDIISTRGAKDFCDFCNKQSQLTYEIGASHSQDRILEDLFTGLISIYKKEDDLPGKSSDGELLKTILRDEWNIFNPGFASSTIEKLMRNICPEFIDANPC